MSPARSRTDSGTAGAALTVNGPRIVAQVQCCDGTHPPERLHLNPLIWEKGHLDFIQSPWFDIARWGKTADELCWWWPWGSTPIGVERAGYPQPLNSGALVGPGQDGIPLYCSPLSPRQAERMGDGPGASISGWGEAVRWVRERFPRLAQSVYIGGMPAWWRTARTWVPEAADLGLGVSLDVVGSVADARKLPNCIRHARFCEDAGLPVSLENHIDANFAGKFTSTRDMPRQSDETRCELVEAGQFLAAPGGAGANLCRVRWRGDEGGGTEATINAACKWLETGRWSVMLSLNSGCSAAQIEQLRKARESARTTSQ